jgi:L-fuconate dehydratase
MKGPDLSSFSDIRTVDIRFPTSVTADGSDAMNLAPDYSLAYVVVTTDAPDKLEGHGFVFTIGRGTEVQVAAIEMLGSYLIGRDVEPLLDAMGDFWRELVWDSQLRWLGPEKGVMQMAIGAVVNALWDLKAKRAGLPLWQLLARMSPEEIVDLVDFTYLSEALTREEALEILRDAEPTRAAREQHLLDFGFPAYTTGPGWLGYSDEKLARLAREAAESGFTQIKLKVGRDRDEDRRRLLVAREAVGPDVRIAIDANQRWGRDEAIEWIKSLDDFEIAWVEEPTSPDDVLAYSAISRAIAPIPVAGGEHVGGRVMFKQFLQADSIQVVQIDATRVGGVNENIAILLLAAKFGMPVCPHAGGVGLCEAVQHLAMFDFVAVAAEEKGRMIEYVDHLHEHFVTPAVVLRGRYLAPLTPGAGTEMHESSVEVHRHGDRVFD